MNIMISQKIKKLRKQIDITQEELAGHLGISFQAISKWERGEGYPDITLLPAIANYFDVTIDELFGMEQLRDQQYLSDVFRKEHEFITQGKYVDAVQLLRDTIKMQPNNYGLLSELAIALSFDDKRESLNEAISLCERVLLNSTSEKVRSTTRTTLCFLYKSTGDKEKAIALAKILPHFWESREMILPEVLKRDEEALRDSTKIILSTLHEKIKATEQGDNTEISSKRMVSSGYNKMSYDLRVIEDFVDQN